MILILLVCVNAILSVHSTQSIVNYMINMAK